MDRQRGRSPPREGIGRALGGSRGGHTGGRSFFGAARSSSDEMCSNSHYGAPPRSSLSGFDTRQQRSDGNNNNSPSQYGAPPRSFLSAFGHPDTRHGHSAPPHDDYSSPDRLHRQAGGRRSSFTERDYGVNDFNRMSAGGLIVRAEDLQYRQNSSPSLSSTLDYDEYDETDTMTPSRSHQSSMSDVRGKEGGEELSDDERGYLTIMAMMAINAQERRNQMESPLSQRLDRHERGGAGLNSSPASVRSSASALDADDRRSVSSESSGGIPMTDGATPSSSQPRAIYSNSDSEYSTTTSSADVSGSFGSLRLCDDSSAPPTPPPPFFAPLPLQQHHSRRDGFYTATARPERALREGKKTVNVTTNVWAFEYEDRLVYRYDVNVGLETINNDGSTRVYSMNKGRRDDASVHERNELIREALKRGLEMYGILSANGCIAVDGSAMMYANEDMDAMLKTCQYKMKLEIGDLPKEVQLLIRNTGVQSIIIEINTTKHAFNIKDLSGLAKRDRSDMDQTVKQFLEVVTSEYALSSRTWSFFSGGNLYRADPDRGRAGVGNKYAQHIPGTGQERRSGMSKGFTLAERKDGEIIPALNVDVTKGTFWSEGPLVDTICEINGWKKPMEAVWDARAIRRTNDAIKFLRVSCTGENGAATFDIVVFSLTASAWTDGASGREMQTLETIHDLMWKGEDGTAQPLLSKFSNRNLRLLNWPLIESRRMRPRSASASREHPHAQRFVVQTEYFPAEILRVRPNQRVPLLKQLGNPDPPIKVLDRWNETTKALDALNLFGDAKSPVENPIMKAFGIRIARAPLQTQGVTRAMPNVKFNRDAQIDAKTTFRTGALSYTTPAHLTKLLIGVSHEDRGQFKRGPFVDALLKAAKAKGIIIGSFFCDTVPPHKLHDVLKDIKDQRVAGDPKFQRVVFMYVEPAESHHHDELKLFERRFCVITQHLTMEVAAKLTTDRPTVENVLLKLNIKGGGHNYQVTPEKFASDLWMGKKTMIMGYDVWHPTGQSRQDKMADREPEPSVVGFSFNGGIGADSFIGDYHYQRMCKERVEDDVLNQRIKWMLGVFERSRGVLPPLIIVIRDGISDGQYRHGMDELEALREGAREYAASQDRTNKSGKPPVLDYTPKFIFVVATKRHHKRLYTADARNQPTNLPPMTAVDDCITNPVLFEFFLQSHNPLKGMAKATKYDVLKDDVGTSMDAMQSLMGALCFEHQVSTNAVSIPEPVYQSDEWAKRGAANYKKFKELYSRMPQFANLSCEEYTDRLSYWNSELERVRVNA